MRQENKKMLKNTPIMKNIFMFSIVGNLNRKSLRLSSGNIQSVNFGNSLRGVHFQPWLYLRNLIIWFRKLNENTPFLNNSLMSKH